MRDIQSLTLISDPTNEFPKNCNKEVAKQRRAQVNRMAGVAFGQQALRSYTAAKKKQRRRASRHPAMRKKKPGQKNLPDPNGIGASLSPHCSAGVFSSQTIDL